MAQVCRKSARTTLQQSFAWLVPPFWIKPLRIYYTKFGLPTDNRRHKVIRRGYFFIYLLSFPFLSLSIFLPFSSSKIWPLQLAPEKVARLQLVQYVWFCCNSKVSYIEDAVKGLKLKMKGELDLITKEQIVTKKGEDDHLGLPQLAHRPGKELMT